MFAARASRALAAAATAAAHVGGRHRPACKSAMQPIRRVRGGGSTTVLAASGELPMPYYSSSSAQDSDTVDGQVL
jgi:hypothetical protein